jgi:hypothetical protein
LWKYDYDVYTDQPRRDAIDYLTLISVLEQRLFKDNGTNWHGC